MTYAEKVTSVYPEYSLENLIWYAYCPADFGFPKQYSLGRSGCTDDCENCWNRQYIPSGVSSRGEFVHEEYSSDWAESFYRCSNCHKRMPCGWGGVIRYNTPSIICPKCGAEIIKEEE